MTVIQLERWLATHFLHLIWTIWLQTLKIVTLSTHANLLQMVGGFHTILPVLTAWHLMMLATGIQNVKLGL